MRDMTGYGRSIPAITWPNHAKVVVNFVINYEEGAELTPINGDDSAEIYGGEFPLPAKPKGQRNYSMESLFEYGSRAGIWRLLGILDDKNIPLTFFATGFALTLNPDFCQYLRQSKHEVAGHGWRWIDYALLSRKEEKKHIILCKDTINKLTGKPIQGWYTGRRSENIKELLREVGGFTYCSDSYADDLPYFEEQLLIIPYTLDCNDFRYTTSPGFSTADDFFKHLKNTFDTLYQEKSTKIMTIALHPRLSGRPGRCVAIQKFIDYIQLFEKVWIATRIEIATHFQQNEG